MYDTSLYKFSLREILKRLIFFEKKVLISFPKKLQIRNKESYDTKTRNLKYFV